MYRAGVLGVGGVGNRHVRAYDEADGITPVAIADVDPASLAAVGEEYSVSPDSRYEDHVDLLENESIDVLSIATPTTFHRDHVLDAVEHGDVDAIFCEKPIATSVADGEAMTEACAAAGVELLVNHTRRWCPETAALYRHLVEEGTLGEVRSASVHWPLELFRNGTHVVDLLFHLLDPVRTVSGHLSGEAEMDPPIDVDDVGGGGHFVTESGTFVAIDATLPRASSTLEVTLVGTEGKIHVDMGSGEIRCWRLTDRSWVEEEFDGLDEWTRDLDVYFDRAIRNVIALLDGRDVPNRSPGSEATAVLEVLIGLYVSGTTGATVELPLDAPLRNVSVTSW